ncbi:MAG: radical SAM protein [Aeromonadales bacterium]|nr:radical SAM protein [Aeromonadales bacterium]MDY2891289.1 radical SAM protein [Succinivibrio sp.]
MKEKYLFRFVPTMFCNFNCDYCFLGDVTKRSKDNMFKHHSAEEWIEGMKNFSNNEIEIYMWGGEPFLLKDTYKILKSWLAMDFISEGCRIDTNLWFAEKIAKLCPSPKLKLNCSYHMHYHSLDEEFRKIKLLKDLDMVGMVNFVASPSNMRTLKNEYKMTVFDLIDKFAEIDVFVNIAGDFAIANNRNYPRHQEYMNFILQFISPEEWTFLRGKDSPAFCSACQKFFFIQYDGEIKSCLDDSSYGNFFKGEIHPSPEPKICRKVCQSLISYPFREDNSFIPWQNLLQYIERCKKHRDFIKEKLNFDFDSKVNFKCN